ncbi:trypsin-7-like [Cylas formicarius]|uniref:trypsin-7-like n=1 Tax=Cylas formicarius TaxID=197179 RepID=UPI0029583B31|nr:trypsin-7-like [Cylas formicarius]
MLSLMVLTWAVFLPTDAVGTHSDPRIIGGHDTNITDHPHQVSVLYFNSHFCGGSLISSKWVLSAAHCTQRFRVETSIFKYSIRLGTHHYNSGGQIVPVLRIIDHPLYGTFYLHFDITLLEMDRNVGDGVTIKPIALPQQGQDILPGTTAVVTGWGTMTMGFYHPPEQLQEVFVPIVSFETCRAAYGEQMTTSMICAGFADGGKDACQGDSGGPLLVNNELVGVVSWGGGCALSGRPGVYASVPAARDWIRNVTGI